jgi:hypothetical protein
VGHFFEHFCDVPVARRHFFFFSQPGMEEDGFLEEDGYFDVIYDDDLEGFISDETDANADDATRKEIESAVEKLESEV